MPIDGRRGGQQRRTAPRRPAPQGEAPSHHQAPPTPNTRKAKGGSRSAAETQERSGPQQIRGGTTQTRPRMPQRAQVATDRGKPGGSAAAWVHLPRRPEAPSAGPTRNRGDAGRPRRHCLHKPEHRREPQGPPRTHHRGVPNSSRSIMPHGFRCMMTACPQVCRPY